MASLSSLLSVSLYSRPKKNQSYISSSIPQNKRHGLNHVPCRVSNEESYQNPKARGDSMSKFDRRDMLFGLGGLYGVTTLGSNKFALADGLLPDVLHCEQVVTPAGNGCCPPKIKEIIKFVPPVVPKLRVRPPAHAMTSTQLEDLKNGIKKMRELRDDDPRSLFQQAKVHCAYCNDAYYQVKNSHSHSVVKYQVHNNALFFPFHRAYLYFFERILGSLIEKPDFAIPFWNWDTPDGMYMPEPYNDSSSSLYDEIRDPRHGPKALLYLNYDGDTEHHDFDVKDCNLHWMKQRMSVKTARKFFGKVIKVSEYPQHIDMGSIEQSPHNNVHNWVGDPKRDYLDMGDFSTAGRDPLFYAHHANVDRMWNIWKTMYDQSTIGYIDPDWKESSFVFYDENKNAVCIKVSDCMDSENLGYVYEDVPIPWMNLKKTPLRNNNWRRSNELTEPPIVNFPQSLNSDITTMVEKPEVPRGGGAELIAEDVVLVLEDVEYDPRTRIHFNVLINVVDDRNDTCPAHHEFVGIFNNIPHGVEHGQAKTSLHFVITEAIQELGLENDEKLAVKIEPKLGGENVTIGGIKIQLEPVE